MLLKKLFNDYPIFAMIFILDFYKYKSYRCRKLIYEMLDINIFDKLKYTSFDFSFYCFEVFGLSLFPYRKDC